MMTSMAMHAQEHGDGDAPVAVLLHAMRFAHDMWDPQVKRLAAHFHVIAPDLPGYGRSPGPFSFQAAVDGLAELLSTTAGGRPVHLCGVSLGARVALKFAAEHPGAVASLFLSGCGIRAPRRLGLERMVMRGLPERFFTRDSPGAGKAATIQSNMALATLDLTGYLPDIAVRTLVVCGAKDTAYLADARELAASITGSELRIIPGAGHFWSREQPEAFTRTFLEWALVSTSAD